MGAEYDFVGNRRVLMALPVSGCAAHGFPDVPRGTLWKHQSK